MTARSSCGLLDFGSEVRKRSLLQDDARFGTRILAKLMRTSVPLFVLLAAASTANLAWADGVPFGPPPGATLSVAKLAPIADFVNGEIAGGRIPGAIVLVQQHGKPVYRKWFGKRDVDHDIAMTEDAIFPIHSVTKTITSIAALMLIDRGTIALDDPVEKYIPPFANQKV